MQSWQAEIRQLDKTTTNAENRYPEGNIEKKHYWNFKITFICNDTVLVQ
jgi:hypothetical protein